MEETGTREAQRSQWLGALLILMLVAGLLLPLMYFRQFTGLSDFDDEGTLLIGFRSLENGRLMYDQIHSLYGPFYNLLYGFFYGEAGIPLTHTSGRFIALSMWVAYGSGFALLVYRLTRSWAAMAIAYAALVIVSRDLANSPGHPEEISLVLVAFALLACSTIDRRARAAALAALGAMLACIALIKINFGVYVGGAITLALLSATRPALWTRVAIPLLACGLLLLPIALETLLIDFTWVRYSIASSTLTIAAALIMVLVRPGAARLNERHWAILAGSFLLAGGLIIALMLFKGSSAYAILNAVLLQNVSFVKNWYLASPVGLRGAAAGMLSLFLCLFSQAPLGGSRLARWQPNVLTLSKLGFAVLALLCIAHPIRILTYLTPFCWLGLAGLGDDARPSIGRTALCLVAAMMSLYPFPVAGHQVNIAGVPTLLVAVMALHDVLTRELPPWRALKLAAGVGGIALTLFVALLTQRSFKTYDGAEPLDLPGTRYIRVSGDRRADLHWAHGALTSCDASYSLPGLFSHALWTKQRLVTDLNSNDPLALLSWRQQEQVVAALAREPDLCVLYNPKMLTFFDRGQIRTNPPLLRYIRTNSVEQARRGDMIILRMRGLAPKTAAKADEQSTS